ncbi:MAG: hypothetical protein ABEK50_13200 [bacterium]
MNLSWSSHFKIIGLFGLVITLGTGFSLAAEHAGEHPGSGTEHHEHAGEEHHQDATDRQEETFTAEEIKTAIRSYITRDQQLKNGFFYIYDKELDRDWRLSFSKLHPVRIIKRDGETIYFACTNFTVKNSEDHDLLDLDFWMKPENGKLKPYKIRIHKVDGNERFTYENDRPVDT